jgi:hypothetical protein
VKRLLAVLAECGLVEVTILHGNERQIRPLVSLADVLNAGWKELCEAVLNRHKFPSALRHLAASVLRRLGVRREPELSRLDCSVESESASFTGRKCAPPARGIAPPFPLEESKVKKTTTVQGTRSVPKPAGVVVSPAEVSEPESEAVTMAVDAGLTVHAARRAVGEKPLEAVRSAVKAARAYAASHEVRSLPALLVTAIRAGWLAPAPPSRYGSDHGERPVRVVVAPAHMRTEAVPRPVEADSSAEAWEALSENERAELLALALAEVLAGGTEPEKSLARRRGVDSLPVVMRAKRLARERAEALGVSDAG